MEAFQCRLHIQQAMILFHMRLVSGDFDDDKQMDLATANYGTNTISLFLGIGNGTFASHTTFSTGSKSHPYSISVGHLNDDTMLDIAIANHRKK